MPLTNSFHTHLINKFLDKIANGQTIDPEKQAPYIFIKPATEMFIKKQAVTSLAVTPGMQQQTHN